MTFEKIIAKAAKKSTKHDLAKIMHQRQIAQDIIAGCLNDGCEMSVAEHKFVRSCQKAMHPVDENALSALQKIAERRWR